jgi:N-acetyl-alpha-D-glucosaminyl L-malate synthase BshA
LFRPGSGIKFREHISPHGEKILIHVSNFRRVKRVSDAIRVFELVKKEVPSRLLLVGDGPDRSDCERLCRELGLQKDVLFLGKQDGLPEILAAGDLFLMPSQSESFGLSALEAMSCGLPVVSSSVGGLPELILHNETGYIAEIGDIERMAKYAVELLTNEKKHEIFSQNSRKRAVENFSKQIIVPQYESFYRRLINGSCSNS